MEVAVKITPALGSSVAVLVPEGATIAEAVEAAGFSLAGLTPRRNGAVVDAGATVQAGDNIILVQQLKGN